jgi:hypothetical protein
LILAGFNSVILEPYIAKVARLDLAKRYFQILGVAIGISVVLCLIAFSFQNLFCGYWVLSIKTYKLRLVGWLRVFSKLRRRSYVDNARCSEMDLLVVHNSKYNAAVDSTNN